MARVLIGWELGAGRGHILSMLAMANALKERGHEVALAVQRFDALPPELPAMAVYQAPVWPGLYSDFQSSSVRASTIIDILARLGLSRPRTLKHLVTGWDALFAAIRPDLVIGDFAPALMVAAQGRLPSIATGPGFQVPPDADPVMRLGEREPGYDEAMLLDIVDADLREAGRAPLDHLGALFRCTRPMIASFAELDPYRRTDAGQFCAPSITGWAESGEARGDEVFVYVNGLMSNTEALWQGLAGSGLPIRAYVPLISPETRTLAARLGIAVEPEPLSWRAIAARSRLIVSHGAHGTMCAALLSGLPHLVFFADLEKALHARAMSEAGFGATCNVETATSASLAGQVKALHADRAGAERTRAAAPRFRERMVPDFGDAVADAVELLI